MDSGMIGKVEKAKRYAQERKRIHFHTFTVTMDGENNPHQIRYADGQWECDCSYFKTHKLCSHTMALEIVLENMIPEKPPVG